MSKSGSKKKVVVTTTPKTQASPTVSKTSSRRMTGTAASRTPSAPLVFGKTNFLLMLAGIGLIMLGLLLMSGGGMEDPNVWDESKIYSPVRTVLAPFIIIVGIVVQIVAIFQKKKPEASTPASA